MGPAMLPRISSHFNADKPHKIYRHKKSQLIFLCSQKPRINNMMDVTIRYDKIKLYEISYLSCNSAIIYFFMIYDTLNVTKSNVLV